MILLQGATGLHPLLKDVVQLASWIAGSTAAAVAAFKGLHELRAARELRREELQWRRANVARDMLLAFEANTAARAAQTMLDWDGREFEVKEGVLTVIVSAEVSHALRTTNVVFSDKETFIRDSFDALFDAMGRFEHAIQTRLIEFSDVAAFWKYWVQALGKRRGTVDAFLAEYSFTLAAAFLSRFPDYNVLEGGPVAGVPRDAR